jgi:flagellar hook-associated protein 2
MGTVGLSFGSPTSGTGFDVSSTVAEIVSNLQNVETPWKNQLSALEKQDTVISSLGTLLSSLSTDMSSLTDFQGILSQKEGSSSDNSVLELMNATSSAANGTYSVVVNSLATTANGYLDSIAKSSDTLTGSITINGTAVNVPDSSTGNNTLSGLASAINSASIGVTASVVTDANGSRLSLVSGTSGASGSLSVTSAVYDGSTALSYNSNLATGANASLSVNGVTYSVASNSVSTVIPGVTFQLLGKSSSGSEVQVVIANDNSGVESTVNQFVSDYNSLVSAINTQEGNDSSGNAEPLFGSPTLSLLQEQLLSGLNAQNPSGYLDSVSSTAGVTLSGSMTIKVGSNSAYTFEIGDGTSSGNTIYTGSGNDTLADLASSINSANIGVIAGVTTSNGESSLTLTSQTAGSSGALTVTSAIGASTPAEVSFADSGYTSSTADSGTLGTAASSSDTLSGSVTIQAGSGAATTIDMSTVDSSEGGTTVGDLVNYIHANSTSLGVDATASSDGLSLTLTSNTVGSTGALAVTSSLYDTSNTTISTLGYTASSDINSITSLGISVNNNGTLTFDANSLDSVLNSDFSSVAGFFQNTDSWGQTFSNMLTNAGTSSSTGILKLAQTSNSNIESSLNAQVSKEELYISAQQKSLTAELNSANEILQALPSELSSVNELYSAITGYNQKSS